MLSMWSGGVFYFSVGVLSVLCGLFFNVNAWVFDVSLFMFGSVDAGLFVLLDYTSLVFVGVLMVICGSVYTFGGYYMEGDIYGGRFFWVLNLFVLSMVILIFCPSVIWLLVGWDGLGVSSVVLVLYYGASSSWSSGVKTYLINRLGDGFLVVVVVYLFLGGCWCYSYIGGGILALVLGVFTKSAQIPFSTWLPVAMAAPTPVSALVHSSTLVTAGVYLLVRYQNCWGPSLMLLVCGSGMITMLCASLAACSEWDSKKIVAYSTLSQLGLMVFSAGLGAFDFCFFHLIVHAIFKALLFIVSGYVLFNVSHLQDIRNLWLNSDLLCLCFVVVNCSLVGLVFFSGFYTKDLIYEGLVVLNVLLWGGFYLGVMLTGCYSFRVVYWLFSGSGISSNFGYSNYQVDLVSVYPLLFMGVIWGGVISSNFSCSMVFSFCSLSFKLCVLGLVLAGIAVGCMGGFGGFYLLLFNNNLFLESFNSSLFLHVFSGCGKCVYDSVDQGGLTWLLSGGNHAIGSVGSLISSVMSFWGAMGLGSGGYCLLMGFIFVAIVL